MCRSRKMASLWSTKGLKRFYMPSMDSIEEVTDGLVQWIEEH